MANQSDIVSYLKTVVKWVENRANKRKMKKKHKLAQKTGMTSNK